MSQGPVMPVPFEGSGNPPGGDEFVDHVSHPRHDLLVVPTRDGDDLRYLHERPTQDAQARVLGGTPLDRLPHPFGHVEPLLGEDVDTICPPDKLGHPNRSREIQVEGRPELDPDLHLCPVDVLDHLHGRALGHEIGALDLHTGPGEGQLIGAHRIDGEEAGVGDPVPNGIDTVAGGVPEDQLEGDATARPWGRAP